MATFGERLFDALREHLEVRTNKLFVASHIVLLVLLASVWRNLQTKTTAEHRDRSVSWAADWEDVTAFHASLETLPVTIIMMSTESRESDEKLVRAAGLRVLWRLDDAIHPDVFLNRFHDGDGVFIAGEHVLEHPQLLRELPSRLTALKGFLSVMEFVPNRLLSVLAQQVPASMVKSHTLSTREILVSNPSLWRARLVRAVDERWVRLVVFRFCPNWTVEENVKFVRSVQENLSRKGFAVAAPVPFQSWHTSTGGARRLIILVFAILIPVISIQWAQQTKLSTIPTFLFVCLASVLMGAVVHGSGAVPMAILGVHPARGVKLQLVAPLMLGLILFISKFSGRDFLETEVKVKHLLAVGASAVVLLGLYLMRSGNFPMIPVTGSERGFRDWLDHILWVRPRFKEAFFGHPLFLLGLWIRGKGMPDFLVSLFLWLGLIGQVSIINTFSHVYAPIEMSLVRTFHGMWIGLLLSAPLILLATRLNRGAR